MEGRKWGERGGMEGCLYNCNFTDFLFCPLSTLEMVNEPSSDNSS